MASIEHYLALSQTPGAHRTLERYRSGVYQCGRIVDSEHIDTTHRAIEALERQLARIDQLIGAWQDRKPRSRS